MIPALWMRLVRLPLGVCAAIYFLLLSCLATASAYYAMFIGFMPYDDEGTLMMAVKEYVAGRKLYDEVRSVYGPIYYFYEWLIRFGLGAPVNHNSTRMTSVVVWVVCALMCGWVAFRLSKSVVVGAVAHLVTFLSFRFFRSEPGHPQELCILLLVGLVASGLLVAQPRRRSIGMILLGATTAALLLVKVNIGVFVILSVALAVLFQSPLTTPSRLARVAAAAAALLLPLAMMRGHLDDSPTRVYCFVVTASTAALLPALVRAAKTVSLSFRDCWTTVASFATTTVAAWLVMMAQGVSSYAIVDSMVLSNLRESVLEHSWYRPLPLGFFWIPWALGGLTAAVAFAWLGRGRPRNAYELLAPVRLTFGAGALVLAAIPNAAQGVAGPPWGLGGPAVTAMLAGFVTPYCWLLLYPSYEDMEPDQVFPRILLATTAVLQTLYAYPIAGSQEVFVRVLFIVVAAVSIGDVLWGAAASYGIIAGPWARASAAAVLLSAPAYYLVLAYQADREYESLPSLALPGAERIHLPVYELRQYQWLARNLREHCDVFIGMPNIPSLNFWTGKDPPTRFFLGDWILGLSDEQQSEVISALSKHPDACVVYNPGLVAFWTGGRLDVSGLPLARYIFNNFKALAVMNNYYFTVRKERDLAGGDLYAP